MNHRLFLPALALGIILLHLLLHAPSTLERPALPLALFQGLTLAAACGLGAQCWQGLLPLCGACWAPLSRLERIGATCLWCSWPMMLPFCSLPSGVLPFSPAHLPWLGEVPLTHQLGASLLLLLLCRLLNSYGSPAWGFLTTILSAAVALGCGTLWWQGGPLNLLTLALCLPLPLLLWSHEEKQGLFRLFFTSLCFCLYSQFFPMLLASYLPGQLPPSVWSLALLAAYTLWVLLAQRPSRPLLVIGGILLLFLGFRTACPPTLYLDYNSLGFLASLCAACALCWLKLTSER